MTGASRSTIDKKINKINIPKGEETEMSQITLNVPDISCAHCEKTVVGALQGKPGVKAVQVNIPAKSVYLDYDENAFSLDQLKEVLDEEGYPVAGTTDGGAPDGRGQNFIPLSSK
jgi:copper chaperone